ncbi:MAG: aquaporin [Chloroflexi bacterium]|nr:aquaporin [Chloroflexota bacterium]
MNDELKRELLAELIGTFVLVFVGSAAVLAAPIFGVVVPAFAHGLILCALIYTYGHISGAQVNPAVTLGLAVGGQQDWTKSAYYIVAQFIGGIIAAAVLVVVFPHENAAVAGFLGEHAYNFGQTTGFLTADSVWTAALYEAILTFFLVSAVFQAAAYGKAGNLAGVAIGFTLAASILAGGPATGASLNPARTLGPALIAGDTSYLIPYLIGIFGGGIVAGLVQGGILKPDGEPGK